MRIHALTTKEAAKPGLVPPLRTPALRSILLGAGAQPKLRVGAVDDPAEAEADRVADKIMCMPDPGLAATASEPPRDQRSILRRKCVQCEEEEKIQRKEMQGPSYAGGALSPAAEVAVNSLGTGAPLPASERAFFEPRFGHSLGHVRVHDGAQAAHAASAVNARAFALGSSVAFARGEYQPGTRGGRELMAHELAHVGSVSTWTRNEHLRRRAHVEEIVHSTEFLEGGWSDVNELGIVYKEGTLETGGGVFLRASPGGEKIEWLAQNTKVYILKHSAKHKAYAVSVVSADGKSGKFGYVAESHVWRNLPDPDSNVLKIEPGQSPVEIAGAHYAGKGFDVWGKDKRYVVNALVWVNQQAQHNAKGKSGVSKEAVDDGWYASKSIAGVYIWLLGVEFMNAIYNSVAKRGGGTGSITADIWQSVKNFASKIAYGLAFVGGLLHGFAKSLWDAVAGLVTTVKDVLVSIFTGNVLSDAKELWNAISGITWEQIKEAVGAWADKWEKELNSPSPWTAGHAHGYLTGYIMAEAAQLLLTGGTLTAAKGALWVSRLGKAIKTTRAFVSFEKGLAKAGEVGSATKKVVGAVSNTIAKSKPFTLLADARHWIGKALMLSAETLKDLALPAINRLRTLSDDALEALQKFAEPFKRVILGCASPAKWTLMLSKPISRDSPRKPEQRSTSSIPSIQFWQPFQKS